MESSETHNEEREPAESSPDDPHRKGSEEPPRGTTGDPPDPDVEGPTPDSERARLED